MALKQCNLFLSSAAVRKQSSGFVKTAESVNLLEVPVSSLHRCSGFLNSVQLPALLSERAEGPELGSYCLLNLHACWTHFTLKQIRAAPFLGASLTISILPYRSLSARSSHSGRQERQMRSRRGNNNRQWVEWGWSSVRELSGGRRLLWHISSMKVNGTEDLQDNTNSTEAKPEEWEKDW